MLHNLFWLTVCALLIAAAFCLVCWSARFPASPPPQPQPDAALTAHGAPPPEAGKDGG